MKRSFFDSLSYCHPSEEEASTPQITIDRGEKKSNKRQKTSNDKKTSIHQNTNTPLERVESFSATSVVLPSQSVNCNNNNSLSNLSSSQSNAPNQQRVIPLGEHKIHCFKLLTNGRFGRVYKGTFGTLKVAVKCFSIVSETSFIRECECMMRVLECKSTLNILGFGEVKPDHLHNTNGSSSNDLVRLGDGRKNENFLSQMFTEYFIVTEYCGCTNLKSLLQVTSREDLWWNEKERLMLELLEGLHEIHGVGICHHDLKPDNILITKEGSHVKIADLGFASFCECEFRKQGKGTLEYTGPETFIDEMGMHSDIWSMGIIFYEICTHGKVPFHSEEEIINENCAVPSLEDYHIPDIWIEVIKQKMLCKDFEKRWSASQILKFLENSGVCLKNKLNAQRKQFLTSLKERIFKDWNSYLDVENPIEQQSRSQPKHFNYHHHHQQQQQQQHHHQQYTKSQEHQKQQSRQNTYSSQHHNQIQFSEGNNSNKKKFKIRQRSVSPNSVNSSHSLDELNVLPSPPGDGTFEDEETSRENTVENHKKKTNMHPSKSTDSLLSFPVATSSGRASPFLENLLFLDSSSQRRCIPLHKRKNFQSNPPQ